MPTSSASSRAAAAVPRLPGGDDAAHRDVPGRRPDVLGRAALVDEHAPVRPADHDEHAAVPEPSGPHLRARHGGHHPVVVVDDVDQLGVDQLGGAGARAHRTCLPCPMANDALQEEARDLLDGAVQLRRDLHRRPEVGNDLPITRDRILEALEGLPLDVTLHESTSGIAALLTGGKPGPTILLRGDMDALPMPEDTGLDFASEVDGAMHACGHDTHVAMLAGVGPAARRPPSRAPRPRAVHVPARRGGPPRRPLHARGGPARRPARSPTARPARSRRRPPSTSRPPCRAAGSRTRRGRSWRRPTRCASGSRARAATPPSRTARSIPIPIACEIVQAMQTMVTRKIDVFDPAVVTVARINAGTTSNVIPETATSSGTIRAVSGAAPAGACTTGCAAWPRASPPPTSVERRGGDRARLPGHRQRPRLRRVRAPASPRTSSARTTVLLPNPVMGAEDFSYVLAAGPGLDGVPRRHAGRAATPARRPPTTRPKVYFDEEAMVQGVALYSALGPPPPGGRTSRHRLVAAGASRWSRSAGGRVRSAACGCSTSRGCSPGRTAGGCWPTWAPTSSRSSRPRAT